VSQDDGRPDRGVQGGKNASMTRILIVDDEPQIRVVLRAYLEREGYAVDEAATGAEAVGLVASEHPDLVLLDIGLPDVDGLEVLRQIRLTSQVYVVMVTARADEVDLLVGLSVGADDYVTKPFSPREVVARVRAVLRRGRDAADAGLAVGAGASGVAGPGDAPQGGASASALRFPGLVVDPERREVRTDAGEVELSALEFDLLAAFASAPGRVFSRAQLLERVWGYSFFGDERVVDVHIRNVRRALGDDAVSPTIIGTVRGVGYKFLKDPS
jgi:DNA-binding response OmpR family regulator